MNGKLYLIPNYLSESNDKRWVAPVVAEVVSHVRHFIVEDARTARRFISSLQLGLDISTLEFSILDKRFDAHQLDELMGPLLNGTSMALMSEAGMPCLADPGNMAVAWAHERGVRVVPFPGSSSILMALVASGFNGQQFTFHGYLPIDKKERETTIRRLEQDARKTGYTQLFMETPYRNGQLLDSLLSVCSPDTHLTIAVDLTGQKEFIGSHSIQYWQKNKPDLHKLPAVFALGLPPW
jgi:16S rRNA (cytidine1402-2'-O)-methyltransferase